MKVTTLREFTHRVAGAGRLSFADLRRLQRDILPDGPQSRDDVEILLALDGALARADAGWPDYLEGDVTAFVLQAAGGVVDADLAGWLLGALSVAQPKTAQALSRAVTLASSEVDESLRAVARVKRKAKVMASAKGLRADRIQGPIEPAPATWAGLSGSWDRARLGSPVLTVRFETGS